MLHEPARDPAGRILGGRLLHIGRDTLWGCALRRYFYLGQDLPSLYIAENRVLTPVKAPW